jgi:hypothetical protein
MNSGRLVFAQATRHLPLTTFRHCMARYGEEHQDAKVPARVLQRFEASSTPTPPASLSPTTTHTALDERKLCTDTGRDKKRS